MLANYGVLDLEQKNEALQRQEMESQLPILQQGRNSPSRILGVKGCRFCIWVCVS